jgi:hypothetical protein
MRASMVTGNSVFFHLQKCQIVFSPDPSHPNIVWAQFAGDWGERKQPCDQE